MDKLPLNQESLDTLLREVRRIGRDQVARQTEAASQIERKPDGSPITPVDRDSDAALRKVLGEITPSIPIISEEHDAAKNLEAMQSKSPVWIVDPLDGTHYYLKGRDNFAIHVALLSAPNDKGEREPVFGIVHMPKLNQVFFTGLRGVPLRAQFAQGDALFDKDPAPMVRTSKLQPDSAGKFPTLRVGLNVEENAEHNIFTPYAHHLNVEQGPTGMRNMKVAEGTLDASYTSHPILMWDVAAPDAILHASGSRMMPVDRATGKVTAERVYYGADESRWDQSKFLGVSAYVAVHPDLIPHLTRAEQQAPATPQKHR